VGIRNNGLRVPIMVEIDVAVVGPTLSDGDGLVLLHEISDANPSASVLVLTSSLDPAVRERALGAGAVEVLLTSVSSEELLNAVRVRQAVEGISLCQALPVSGCPRRRRCSRTWSRRYSTCTEQLFTRSCAGRCQRTRAPSESSVIEVKRLGTDITNAVIGAAIHAPLPTVGGSLRILTNSARRCST
jgi:DNA-binding response OmpR family regulator